jgi:DNA mismatch endonuclease (patch repair protein)
MVDRVSRKKRSEIMSKIRPVSKIERVPARLKALRLRHQPTGVFGNPDFANKSKKVALFIDGCFWHGCRFHFKCPKSHPQFWANKIGNNIMRDKKVNETLIREGWTVIRIWEHDLKEMK